jgi:stress response protein YsnF
LCFLQCCSNPSLSHSRNNQSVLFNRRSSVIGFFRMKEESSSSDDDHSPANPSLGSGQPEPMAASSNVCYKKTLRLTSEQLVHRQTSTTPL